MKRSLSLAITLVFVACGGSSTDAENQPNPTVTDPTFARVYAEIIQPGCGCHVSGAGGLSMPDAAAAHAALVEQPANGTGPCAGETRVISGDAQSSVLYRKLSGTNLCGAAMPMGGQPISSEKLQLLEAWIGAGAVND